MKRKKVYSGMKRIVMMRFPKEAEKNNFAWDIFAHDGNISFSLKIPGIAKSVEFALSPEDAYEVREDIGHAYDQVYGI